VTTALLDDCWGARFGLGVRDILKRDATGGGDGDGDDDGDGDGEDENADDDDDEEEWSDGEGDGGSRWRGLAIGRAAGRAGAGVAASLMRSIRFGDDVIGGRSNS